MGIMLRVRALPAGFIAPCLPTKTDKLSGCARSSKAEKRYGSKMWLVVYLNRTSMGSANKKPNEQLPRSSNATRIVRPAVRDLEGQAALIVGRHQDTAPRRSRGQKPDRRRALELLPSCRDGCTEAILLVHGFTIEQRWSSWCATQAATA
jgi:hypothetical protein